MEESEMKKLRIFALLMALLMVLPLVAACKKTNNDKKVEYQPIDPADAIEHKDYTSVYDKIGNKVTIDMVTEITPKIIFVAPIIETISNLRFIFLILYIFNIV